jgi:hypothetical protein
MWFCETASLISVRTNADSAANACRSVSLVFRSFGDLSSRDPAHVAIDREVSTGNPENADLMSLGYVSFNLSMTLARSTRGG